MSKSNNFTNRSATYTSVKEEISILVYPGGYMNKFTRILSVIIFTIGASAAAEIRQIETMQGALADVSAGDVVVFDIDNTILEPVQTLGSDQWFEFLVKKYEGQGQDHAKAILSSQQDWNLVQQKTEVRLVETRTAKLIRKLQFRGITVIALTARPDSLSNVTARQLSSLGVHIEQYAGYSNPEVVYANGIIFSAGKNKGVILRDFLERLNIQPQRLIFVDDKEKNVSNMDAEFVKTSIVNINYRYSAADTRVHAFSADIAELQWEHFLATGELLTDEEAQELLSYALSA